MPIKEYADYSNNGEFSAKAKRAPLTPAEERGENSDWMDIALRGTQHNVDRHQSCED
jgi:hypothetical protein